jgi:hypothetical protein
VSPGLHTHAHTRAEVSSPAPLSFKVPSPKKEAPSQVPLWSSCIENGAPSAQPSLHISQSPQKRNPPSRCPLQSPYIEEDAPSPEPSLRNSQSPQKRTPPPFQVPLTEPLHRGRCSISRALSTYFSRSPVQSPLYISLKVRRKEPPPPGSPYGASPYRKALHLQSRRYITLKVPRKETPLQVALTEPLRTERCFICSGLFACLSEPPEKEPPLWVPLTEPLHRDVPSPEPSLHIFKSPRN